MLRSLLNRNVRVYQTTHYVQNTDELNVLLNEASKNGNKTCWIPAWSIGLEEYTKEFLTYLKDQPVYKNFQISIENNLLIIRW